MREVGVRGRQQSTGAKTGQDGAGVTGSSEVMLLIILTFVVLLSIAEGTAA